MRISRSYNKKTGVTYVYEVLENHWDKEKGYPVNKRRLIGKIDPETGEIVPTRKRAKAAVSSAPKPPAQSTEVKNDTSSQLEILNSEKEFLQNLIASSTARLESVQSMIDSLS